MQTEYFLFPFLRWNLNFTKHGRLQLARRWSSPVTLFHDRKTEFHCTEPGLAFKTFLGNYHIVTAKITLLVFSLDIDLTKACDAARISTIWQLTTGNPSQARSIDSYVTIKQKTRPELSAALHNFISYIFHLVREVIFEFRSPLISTFPLSALLRIFFFSTRDEDKLSHDACNFHYVLVSQLSFSYLYLKDESVQVADHSHVKDVNISGKRTKQPSAYSTT